MTEPVTSADLAAGLETLPAPGEPQEQIPGVTLVLAPNANAWTFEGTNTWILTGGGDAVVVDPGPDDPMHLDTIDAVVRDAGASVREILLTHHHGDHSQAARPLAARWSAPIRPRVQQGLIPEGTVFDVGGLHAHAIRTPGHTADGISLVLPDQRVVLTGDTVLARINPFISHPDGTVRDMLASMQRLGELCDDDWTFFPGHGPLVREPRRYLQARTSDRRRRIDQVAELAGLGHSAEQITASIHPALAPVRMRAARASVEAILTYLTDTDRSDSSQERLNQP